MKNLFVLWILSMFSCSICATTIGAAGLSYPEDNVGMLYGYTPGPFTSTDSPTDLAIDGMGFFILRASDSDELFFTEIGNFDFDDEGYLVSSQGYIVNGWELNEDAESVGAVRDIKLSAVDEWGIPLDKSKISVGENGMILIIDSMGSMVPLYQIALSQFPDPHSLEGVGDNLFKETSDSGTATASFPGSYGLGRIKNYSLEEMDPDFSYEADIWVDGDGYFVVRDPDDENQIYYTTSGAFRLNKDGQMVSSGDLVVLGWKLVTNDITEEVEKDGAVSDIEFPSFTAPPKPSDHITVVANIDADSVNHSAGAGALSYAWNGSLDLDGPIPTYSYEHRATASVYDLLGNTHDISIYFDKADTTQTVEFIVTCDPKEDIRFSSSPDTDSGRGLLGRGTINFTAEGEFSGMTFERLVLSDPLDGGAWEPQDVSTNLTNQHFTLTANFLGLAETATDIELDLGAGYDGSTWIADESSTTYTSQSSCTVSVSANGYGAQVCARVLIDEDGIITAYYSEGLVRPSFQVALASFEDESALNEVDTGLFEETSDSGSPTVSQPNENGFGTLAFNDPGNKGAELRKAQISSLILALKHAFSKSKWPLQEGRNGKLLCPQEVRPTNMDRL